MEVAYCKIMFKMLPNKVLILFNIYRFFHLSYYSCFSCGKKCFPRADYDKIVSNIKKLMQDPCSKSVFVFFCSFMFLLLFCICFFSFCLFVFLFFFFLFSLGPLWVLISGLKPKEAYSKSARTVRKFEALHSEGLPEKNKSLIFLKSG